MSSVGHSVELYEGEVTLNIVTTNTLGKEYVGGSNFGYIQVGNNQKDKENCFWDNLNFFVCCDKKQFKKECKKELKKKGFKVGETYENILELIKAAIKLGILDTAEEINNRRWGRD